MSLKNRCIHTHPYCKNVPNTTTSLNSLRLNICLWFTSWPQGQEFKWGSDLILPHVSIPWKSCCPHQKSSPSSKPMWLQTCGLLWKKCPSSSSSICSKLWSISCCWCVGAGETTAAEYIQRVEAVIYGINQIQFVFKRAALLSNFYRSRRKQLDSISIALKCYCGSQHRDNKTQDYLHIHGRTITLFHTQISFDTH